MTSEVTTFGRAMGHGGRMSQFTTSDGLTVSVVGSGEDSTQPAYQRACELAHSDAVLTDLRAEVIRIREELDRARLEMAAKMPPASPARLLGTGYVRFSSGKLWMLGNREKGWSSFGYQLTDWDDLFRRYNVRVTTHGKDRFGAWWAVENCAHVCTRDNQGLCHGCGAEVPS